MRLKKATLCKRLLGMVGIILISTLPYFHDVITGAQGIRYGVPIIGAEKLFTGPDGLVMGFSSYRVFLYTLCIHLFAHIGYVGWMMDAKGKYYRIALLVPVILSGYTTALILLNAKETSFNETSTKLFLTLGISLGVLIYYILDNRKKIQEHAQT
ncbi:hypothetical protein [Maribacter aurantiacus]|uniref:Uncharacterized protein n=1 Tax=Maribacter aurantiacus TaxID=1882343 RepID=A0A5R8MBX2_9FLAO|nr:hypothetical protein [Maribacter aurantiacus]TLF47025.1 hypothetical protein FEK29_04460 [Maribacter aurantiacus]